ncbi:TPA: sensor histidine kinase [Streptococcus agalactiae]
MDIKTIIILILLCVILYLVKKITHIKKEIDRIQEVLVDIKNGDYNRRILIKKNDTTEKICHDINEITLQSQNKLIEQKQSEQAYKSIMTSLSHDVKTPLASMVGYLEAVQEGLVTGDEKDDYIKVSLSKAHHLKDFVEKLFDWVKLDSGEWKFSFADKDLNELTRNVISDWIPIFEEKHISYEIEIPEQECNIRIDENAYFRSLNNIINNIIVHSNCDRVHLKLEKSDTKVTLTILDNGDGISEKDLPYIFDRMYQADSSRLTKGSGLGLSISKELLRVNNAKISVSSVPNIKTVFTVEFAM